MKGEFSCIKCKENMIWITKEEIYESSLELSDHLIFDYGLSVKTFDCKSSSTANYYPQNQDIIQNCFSFYLNTDFYCNACK